MALVGVLGLAVVYHGFRRGGGGWVLPLYIMALGGGVLGLAVVYHGFRGGPRFCRCISWL